MLSNTITLRMIDGRYINGVPYAPGERVTVRAEEAFEIVANRWAEFVRDGDAERARKAFVEHQAAELQRVNKQSPVVPRDPRWPI